MRTEVIVHTKSSSYCGQCVTTMRALETAGIEFTEAEGVDLPENANLLAEFKARGLASAPIVVVKRWTSDKSYEQEEWAGFRPDKISELSQQIKEAAA